jgi:enamine deaminase RidA (YjgF/YER057c/UK114 family)
MVRVRATARAGNLVTVMGMVGRDVNGALVSGTAAQAHRALERVEEALDEVGLNRASIVRLRLYLVDISEWSTVREEVIQFFGEEWPPTTVVGVSALVEPAMRVEIEADAAA